MAPDPNRWGPKPPQEISEERYHEMLNVLPPCRWHGIGELFESFHVSERLSGNVVSWFVRYDERFFQIDDDATKTREELLAAVRAYIAH